VSARRIETASPGTALPVRISLASDVTPSEGDAPVSSDTATIDGVVTAVLTENAAEDALGLPATSVATAVNE
jgi:hypothetical protein